ncbi:MAG: hypothetical protein ACRDQW_14805 [Haloechinothrix sp.]
MAGVRVCPAGHSMPAGSDRICQACRREEVIAGVAASGTSLSDEDIAAAVDAVVTGHAGWRSLAAALRSGPNALARGAPPVVGRLVMEMIARGCTVLSVPTCVVCGRTGRPLTVTDAGGMCKRCAARRNPQACTYCGGVKPIAGRTIDAKPFCEPCRRHRRGHRRCGMCGKTASIALRARDGGESDICVNCYRLPAAVCHVCGRLRPCTFATSDRPICKLCAPRVTAPCARCGHDRPPAVRWDEGPLCDPCYTAALRRRGRCATCGDERRLVTPAGPDATTCADCAGLPVTHACLDCSLEDKLYEKDRCARCSLRRRATELLSTGSGQVPAALHGVLEAWRVMRRLRRSAQAKPTPRTYTAHAKLKIKLAAEFLAWLDARDTALADCRQGDIEQWLLTGPRACHVRDFLTWAAHRWHCPDFDVPAPERITGTATDPDQRWEHVRRLLHDDDLTTTDRVAGCFLLLFGQQQSRIAVMTTDQITQRGTEIFVRFGKHDVPVPEPLGELLLLLIADGKSHVGIGTPTNTRWLFPGGMPGQPITPARLAERLNVLGISSQTGRRAALIDLAAQMPAAVLADLINMHPATAVKWMLQAGGNWSRYAAELARTRNHQPCE